MKSRWLSPLMFAILAARAFGADPAAPAKKALDPHPVSKTFYVTGVKADFDAAKILAEVRKLPSVTDAGELTARSGYIRVAFDTHAIASHLVAQTILNNGAEGVHITFSIPEYAANAEKLDALFAKIEKERSVKIEPQDKAAGQFKLTYLPITPDPADPRKVGFNYGQLGHPVHDPAPKGLGLTIQMQDVPDPGAGKGKGKGKGKKKKS